MNFRKCFFKLRKQENRIKYDVIIFSQAPSDISYVLEIYEKYKAKSIKIIVINVKSNFRFYKSLNLDVELEFIPLVSQKKMLRFAIHIFKIKFLYLKKFRLLKNIEVYFFAINYDYVTAFFVEKLAKQNKVIFIDIFQVKGKEVVSRITKIKKTFAKKMLGITLKFFKLSGGVAYQYVLRDSIIEKKRHTPVVDEKYFLKSKVDSKKKNLLFFENGEENYYKNYNKDLLKVIKTLNEKYNIYIKPHPRLGYSKILNKYNVNVIDSSVPAELINLSSFDVVLGITTVSIATVCHSRKYCIIDLFEFKNDSVKDYYKNYLNSKITGSMYYIEGVNDIV